MTCENCSEKCITVCENCSEGKEWYEKVNRKGHADATVALSAMFMNLRNFLQTHCPGGQELENQNKST